MRFNNMLHYTYRIDNLINGKYYIGKHSSDSLDDDYMGSGPLIKAAIAKYGIENFKKTILKTFPTSEEAFEHEAQIVTMAEVNDPMCYNIQPGGKGRQKRFTEEELREHKSEWLRDYYQQNKERILERQRGYDQRPGTKERQQEHRREYHQRPGVKERQSEYMKEYHQRPGVKERQREYMKDYNQRSEVKERQREYHQQNKEYISEYMKEYYQQNKEQYREYYQQNKERILEQHREYMKEYRRKKREQEKKMKQTETI